MSCDSVARIEKAQEKDGTIPLREITLDPDKLVRLIKQVKSLAQTSNLIFAMSETGSENLQALVNKLQFIVENPTTKDNPYNAFSLLNQDDVITGALFPLAIQTTEKLLQTFKLGNLSENVNLQTHGPQSEVLVSMRLCTYPHVVKSIILSMSSLLMVYKAIASLYCTHNRQIRARIQQDQKAFANIDSLQRMCVYIDKRFQTAFMPAFKNGNPNSTRQLTPLATFYSHLSDYLCTSLGPKNPKLPAAISMFSQMLEKLNTSAKSGPTKTPRAILNLNLADTTPDIKNTAAEIFLDRTTVNNSQPSDYPFNDNFFPRCPMVSSAAGPDVAGQEDIMAELFNYATGLAERLPECGFAGSSMPPPMEGEDFFSQLLRPDFMCSNMAAGPENVNGDEDVLRTADDNDNDNNDNNNDEENDMAGKSSSSVKRKRSKKNKKSKKNEKSSKRVERGQGCKRGRQRRREGIEGMGGDSTTGRGKKIMCQVISSSSSSSSEDENCKKIKLNACSSSSSSSSCSSDNDDNAEPTAVHLKLFTRGGAPPSDDLTEIMNNIAEQVAQSLAAMDGTLTQVPASDLNKSIRSVYSQLDDVLKRVLESLNLTQKEFCLDLLTEDTKERIRGELASLEELEQNAVEGRVPETLPEQMKMVTTVFVSKIGMLRFLKEEIDTALERVRAEVAEYSILESTVIIHNVLVDSHVRRVYDSLINEPRSLVQLAVPLEAVPIIYQLNANVNCFELYKNILEHMHTSDLILQLNAFMVVPIEFYMLSSRTTFGFFNNSTLYAKYKENYLSAVKKMFSCAVLFSANMSRQYFAQEDPTASLVPLPMGATRDEKMMIKCMSKPEQAPSNVVATITNPQPVISSSFGNQKFEFVRNTVAVEKELQANSNNYIQCLTAFTTGLANLGSTTQSQTAARTSSASMFLLTNFIYSLDTFVMLNLIGIQLQLITNVDPVVDIVYTLLEQMIGENLSEAEPDNVPRMFVMPIARLLSMLLVFNPRTPPNTAAFKITDDLRLYKILVDIVQKKAGLLRELSESYNTTIQLGQNQAISVSFSLTNQTQSQIQGGDQEYRIKPEFFEKLWSCSDTTTPNLLNYVETIGNGSSKRAEIGRTVRPLEYGTLISGDPNATITDHFAAKCALLSSMPWLNYLLRASKVVVSTGETFHLTPLMFKTSAVRFEIFS